MRPVAFFIALSLSIGFSLPAFSAQKLFLGVTVFTTASTTGNWGGCFSKISLPASAFTNANLSGCEANFISFGCIPGDASDRISKSDAARNYSNAQMAYVIQHPVNMLIDDSINYNGYCTAIRVDNAPR